MKSIAGVNTMEEEALPRSPRDTKGAMSAIKTRPRAKPNKEGMKAKVTYKAAMKIHD